MSATRAMPEGRLHRSMMEASREVQDPAYSLVIPGGQPPGIFLNSFDGGFVVCEFFFANCRV
jgi:hypothetical protein